MIHRSKFIFRLFCITFWIVTCSPFVMEEFLTPLAAIRSFILIVCDALIVMLGLMTLRDRRQVWLIVSFFALAFVSTILLNDIGWLNFFNGSRLFFGMLFVPSILMYLFNCDEKDRYRVSLDRQMFVFLCLQAFCVTWQFFRYGAGDHGGGSMGNGNSGVISTLIILLVYYFTTRDFDPDDFKKSLWRNRKYLFLVFPVALNETKISFILLLVFILLLYRFKGKSMVKLVLSFPLIIGVGILFQFAYDAALGGGGLDMSDKAEIREYLFGNDMSENIGNMQDLVDADLLGEDVDGELAVQDLQRFIKIQMTPIAVAETPGGTFFGAGLGHFKGGTRVEKTEFYKQNEWLITGTVNMFMFLYMQLGLLGFVWFAFYLIFLLDFRKKEVPYAAQLKLFLLAVAVMSIFYNECFQILGFCLIYTFLAVASSASPLPDKKNKELLKS